MWSYREMLGCVPLGVFLEWAGIQLPALVVEQVTTGQTFAHAATLVGILLGATLLAAALRDFLTAALRSAMQMFRYRENTALYRKVMRCLYQKFESKSVRDLYQRAMSALWMNNGIVKLLQVPQESMNVIQNLLCYFLFGTVISFVSPWLVVLLTALPMVNWFCVRGQSFDITVVHRIANIRVRRMSRAQRPVDGDGHGFERGSFAGFIDGANRLACVHALERHVRAERVPIAAKRAGFVERRAARRI